MWYVEGSEPPRSPGRNSLADAKARLVEVLKLHGLDVNRQRGAWQSVKCPYHQDERASASVNLELQRFNCHTCGVHGDAVDLVAEREGLPTREAIEWILSHTQAGPS